MPLCFVWFTCVDLVALMTHTRRLKERGAADLQGARRAAAAVVLVAVVVLLVLLVQQAERVVAEEVTLAALMLADVRIHARMLALLLAPARVRAATQQRPRPACSS